MAKKKTASGGMNRTERVAGTIFFLVYLLVMPLLATRIFDLLEVVLDTTINDSLRNVLYYYTLFAVTVLLFHSYLAHTSGRFLDNLNRALSTMLLGLLVFYGANELIFRVCNVLFNSRTNLNDMTIAAQVASAPRMTALIVVLLAPWRRCSSAASCSGVSKKRAEYSPISSPARCSRFYTCGRRRCPTGT